MKKLLILLSLFFITLTTFSQGFDCASADPFCSDDGGYTFPASTNVASLGEVGCLYTTPNPAWYWMEVAAPGDIDIHMTSGGDVDFIAWGPFPSLAAGCASDPIGNDDPGVDCSYSTAAAEDCNIPNAQTGEVYILLITNYANIVTNISFDQTGGAGSTNCGIMALIVNNGPLCENEDLILTVSNPIAGATYAWTGPNGFVSTQMNPTIPNVTMAQNGDYTLVITSGGVSSDPTTTTVIVNPNPTIAAIPNPSEICSGEQSALSVAGANTYEWLGTGSILNPYDVSPIVNTTYTVVGTSIDGCTDTTTVDVIVNPNPNINITTTDVTCFQLNDGVATANITNATQPYTYSWASLTNVQSNLQSGNYTLIVTDANNCTNNQNFTINEPNLLQINNFTTTDVSCFNDNDGTISVNVVGGTGAVDYNWSDNTINSPNRTNLEPGTYTLIVTDNNDCTVSQIFNISEPDELLSTTSPDISICEGSFTNILGQAIGGVPPYNYYWNNVINTQNINVTPLITTSYELYIEDANNCLSNISNVLVTVSPKIIIDTIIIENNSCYNSCDGSAEIIVSGGISPLIFDWTSSSNISTDLCEGIYPINITDNIGCSITSNFIITQPTQLSYSLSTTPANCHGENGEASVIVNGGTPPYNYLWSNGDDTPNTNIGAGSYTFTVTDDNNCRITPNYTITEPSDIYVLPIGNRTICQGQSTTLTTQVTGGQPYYDFHWSSIDGVYNSNQYEVSPLITTVYSLVITDSHGCSSAPISSTVYVNPDLEILSIVTSNDTICPGDASIIDVDITGGNGGPYTLTVDGNIVTSPFSVYPHTTSMIYVNLDDMCGTPTTTDSILINVQPKPNNLFEVDVNKGCPPFIVNFSEISPNIGQTYFWIFGDDSFASIKNPTHVYNETGNYNVTLEVTNLFGCKNIRTINNMIEVYQNPNANFETDRQYASFLSSEIEFINHSTNYVNSFWFFGDGDSSIFRNPRHIYNDIGEFEIMLVVDSYHNCKDTTTKIIRVNNEITFYVPTAFTPDGDGFNDCFRACGTGISKNNFSMSVYDRWGSLVYFTDKFVVGSDCYDCENIVSWNGRGLDQEKKLPNDVYVWYCEYEDFNGVGYIEHGTVNLIR